MCDKAGMKKIQKDIEGVANAMLKLTKTLIDDESTVCFEVRQQLGKMLEEIAKRAEVMSMTVDLSIMLIEATSQGDDDVLIHHRKERN